MAADKRHFFDIWVVEPNTVYREVPYTVVADWAQQGRILEDDRLRPSGTTEWGRAGDSPDFAPYMPRPEPFRADDQAEALEPVHLDFAFKRPHDEEEGDVDMIPLIDVSLVLLIFFMMTATVASASIPIPTPPAETGQVANNTEGVWLGIDLVGEDKKELAYSVGEGSQPPAAEDRDLQTQDEALNHLDALLKKRGSRTEVTIDANPAVKSGIVREMTAALEGPRFRDRVTQKFIGVSEKLP